MNDFLDQAEGKSEELDIPEFLSRRETDVQPTEEKEQEDNGEEIFFQTEEDF